MGTAAVGKPKGRTRGWSVSYLERKLVSVAEPHSMQRCWTKRDCCLASERSKPAWVQKTSAGNGISAKFKVRVTIASRCQASIHFLVFRNVYRFHFHLSLYVNPSNFPMWGAEDLYPSSLKRQCWGICVRSDMTNKMLCMFLAAVDLVCLQSKTLLTSSGNKQNKTSLPSLG